MTNQLAKNPSNRRVATLSSFTAAAPCLNMAGLSQNELKAIRAHPMRNGLKTFRTTFKSRYLKSENVNLTEIVDLLTSEASNTGEGTLYGFTNLLIGGQARRMLYLILSWHFRHSQLLEAFAHGLGMGPSAVILRPFTLASPQTKEKPNMSRRF